MNTDPQLHRLYRPRFLEGKLLSSDDIKPRYCRMCPAQLGPTVKYYCSGDCMKDARKAGVYGREEASAPGEFPTFSGDSPVDKSMMTGRLPSESRG